MLFKVMSAATNNLAARNTSGIYWYDLKISGSKGLACSLE
jgi:hypothetical protein